MENLSPDQNALTQKSPQIRDEDGERTLAKLREGASDAVEMVKTKANEVIEPIKDHALNIAEEQKNAGAEKMDGVARAVHEAADKIEEQIPHAGGYVHQVAAGLEEASAAVRGRSLGEILGVVEDFARREPVAFFGAAVLAGFVCTRFLKATAQPARPVEGPQPSGGTGQGFAP